MRREYRRALLLLPAVLLLSTWHVMGQAKTEDGAIAAEQTGVDNVAGGALPKDTKVADVKTDQPAVKTDETKVTPIEEKKADVAAAPEVPAPANNTDAVKTDDAKVTPIEEKKADVAAAPEVPAPANNTDAVKTDDAKVTPIEEKKADVAANPDVKAVVEPTVDKIEEKPAEGAPKKIDEAPVAEAPKPADKPEGVDKVVEDALKEATKEGIPPRPVLKANAAPKSEAVKNDAVAPAAAKAPVDAGAKPDDVKAPLDANATEVMLVKEGEILRRNAYEKHAAETLDEAEKALIQRRLPEAVKLFEEADRALKQVSDRPENLKDRVRARKGLADAYFRYALMLKDLKDFDRARPMANQAYNNGHPKASELLVQIDQARKEPPPPPEKPQPLSRAEEFKLKQKEVAQFLNEGRQYFSMQEYAKAQEKFGSVLRRDPENTEAIRYLNKISQKKLDRATMELNSTRKDMVSDVRKTWNPRNYGVNEPQAFASVSASVSKGPIPSSVAEKDEIIQQLGSITIPEIEFKQANIYDVIDELQKSSLEYDPKKKGVNIIPAFGKVAGGDTNAAAGSEFPPVTFHARGVNLAQALKVVSEMAGLKYRIEGRMIKIVRADAPDEELVQRMYDVVKDFVPRVPRNPNTGDKLLSAPPLDAPVVGGEESELRDKFKSFGVQWPLGSSITHVKEIGKLVVWNTPDNLAKLEQILSVINVTPRQVEIEARFVEVNQTDLASLGFEWMLTDSWKIAQKKGQGNIPPNQRQMLVMPRTDFTQGERFLDHGSTLRTGASASPVADNFLTFASVLTNPELMFVVHMLEQQGHTDLLSAPKVTTREGSEASIRVVTEYIYPTEFTVLGGAPPVIGPTGVIASPATPPIVTPAGFEKREVGVILTVNPTVLEEGNQIDLTMTPQVVTEPTWKNYGSTYYDANGRPQFQLPMEQPFFHVRTVQTSISIYNGATVVMGGMITENRVDVEDKIPFLGDIPLIGRLFRSKHDESEKRNLLIFVTARLVDPAGREIKRRNAPVADAAAKAAR